MADDSLSRVDIGVQLRARRLARGISLRQFARDLRLSPSYISQLETGKVHPSVATLFAICAVLEIPTDGVIQDYANGRVRNSLGSSKKATNDTDIDSRDGDNSFDTSATMPSPDTGKAGVSSPVVRAGDRKILTLDSGVTWESLTEVRNQSAAFTLVRYDVGGNSIAEGRLIRHSGTEYVLIMSGILEFTLEFENYTLQTGDAVSFDSSRPHRFANLGNVPVEAVWVNLERFGLA